MWPMRLRSFLLQCWDVQPVGFGIYSSRREREFHRDWMCVWKCYGNKLGLPGLLVTSMLIVASVRVLLEFSC